MKTCSTASQSVNRILNNVLMGGQSHYGFCYAEEGLSDQKEHCTQKTGKGCVGGWGNVELLSLWKLQGSLLTKVI